MSQQMLYQKNIELSGKLANFVISGGVSPLSLKGNVVLFAHNNKELNDENNKLLKKLLRDGERVTKATLTSEVDNIWSISPAHC